MHALAPGREAAPELVATVLGRPARTEPLGPRRGFDPSPEDIVALGEGEKEATVAPGAVALARSGDKGPTSTLASSRGATRPGRG